MNFRKQTRYITGNVSIIFEAAKLGNFSYKVAIVKNNMLVATDYATQRNEKAACFFYEKHQSKISLA